MMALFHYTEEDKSRFLGYVRVLDNGCWEWTGGRSRGAQRWNTEPAWYGSFWVDGKTRRAHIVSAEMFGSGHHPGYHQDHTCNFTLCVRPSHLECVPGAVNERRKHHRRRA